METGAGVCPRCGTKLQYDRKKGLVFCENCG